MLISTSAQLRKFLESFFIKNWQKKGFVYYLLLPLSHIYEFIIKRRKISNQPHRSKIPVVVIGNVYVGGTGKTPITKSIATYLISKGLKTGLISRGYGIKIPKNQPRYASPDSNNLELSSFIGDEPSELSKIAPIAVGPDRNADIDLLTEKNPDLDVILSDDGLQNTQLYRDIEIVVFDDRLVGNAKVLPAGPLREPLSKLQSVEYIICNSSGNFDIPIHSNAKIISSNMRIIKLENLKDKVSLNLKDLSNLDGKIIAMAGIGNPNKFFNTLNEFGIKAKQNIHLPDHFVYDLNYLRKLEIANYFVTSKDATKIERLIKLEPLKSNFFCVHVEPVFEPAGFLEELTKKIKEIKENYEIR
ncbi:tetraacyldisaccharide 4'-kinase [Taylorella equigenitalis]|nr:tetraacyldisaccharide 4'-kinase [Taylorella equigenitalis]